MSPINRNHNDEKSVKPAVRRMHGLRLLSLLLLVSLACSIPGLGKPEATETPPLEVVGETIEQTPTQVAGPIGSVQELPPALVETDPPAGRSCS